MSTLPVITWNEERQQRKAIWRAENGSPPPTKVIVVEDTMKADEAYHLACEGTSMLWRGDFQNAKQLLLAMARRVDAKAIRAKKNPPPPPKPKARPKPAESTPAATPIDAFNKHRLAQSQRARTLSRLLIPFDSDFSVPLGRAPDVRQACVEAWGATGAQSVTSLRELLGIIGAYEWRRKGVPIAALDAKVHPHYGVFAPIRSEYVDLVNEAALPEPLPTLAFDIGTGTGVLAAVLAQRGIRRVIATDMDPRALVCARDNIRRLQLQTTISVVEADLFPPGRANLVVCNPPWLPARPSSPLERAIYDPDSQMLRGFLTGLAAHLEPAGEGWLVLSDLAEHLGMRSRETLLGWIDTAGLRVIERLDVRPHHPRVSDASDPLHAARAKEVTSLWRLGVK